MAVTGAPAALQPLAEAPGHVVEQQDVPVVDRPEGVQGVWDLRLAVDGTTKPLDEVAGAGVRMVCHEREV